MLFQDRFYLLFITDKNYRGRIVCLLEIKLNTFYCFQGCKISTHHV